MYKELLLLSLSLLFLLFVNKFHLFQTMKHIIYLFLFATFLLSSDAIYYGKGPHQFPYGPIRPPFGVPPFGFYAGRGGERGLPIWGGAGAGEQHSNGINRMGQGLFPLPGYQ